MRKENLFGKEKPDFSLRVEFEGRRSTNSVVMGKDKLMARGEEKRRERRKGKVRLRDETRRSNGIGNDVDTSQWKCSSAFVERRLGDLRRRRGFPGRIRRDRRAEFRRDQRRTTRRRTVQPTIQVRLFFVSSFVLLVDRTISSRNYRARLIRYGSKRISILQFSPRVVYGRCPEAEQIGEKHGLTFKFVKNETKLIRNILEGHGFREVHPSSSEFNVLWTGGGMKPFTLRSLLPYQRVNHFPR